MYKFKSLIFSFIIVMPAMLFAQSKVGYVNTRKILDELSDVKIANHKLDSISAAYEKQSKDLEEEYNKLADKKDTQAAITMAQRIQAFQQGAKEDFQKKQENLMNPIRKKVADAIKRVSSESNYSIVFDSSLDGVILYVNDADDLTDAVRKTLGIK
jgi:outer membrane protein